MAESVPPRKKLNKADFMFKDREGEELVKKPGDINGTKSKFDW